MSALACRFCAVLSLRYSVSLCRVPWWRGGCTTWWPARSGCLYCPLWLVYTVYYCTLLTVLCLSRVFCARVARVYDLVAGKERCVLAGHSNWVTSIQVVGGQLSRAARTGRPGCGTCTRQPPPLHPLLFHLWVPLQLKSKEQFQ